MCTAILLFIVCMESSRYAQKSILIHERRKHSVCTAEKTHLYFLKIHKAGSTTIANIFWRFGLKRNLNILTLFKGFMSYPNRTFDDKLPPFAPPKLKHGKYDMYCEHSIYNEQYLMTKVHEDTKHIAIIREPMSHLRSTFNFYNLKETLNLSDSPDPVADFLLNPEAFCKKFKSRAKELTHNRVAIEFGYEGSLHDLTNYLKYIESKFFVLILEMLSQSLILMRRQLCWHMKDIILTRSRQRFYDKGKINDTLVQMYKLWSLQDYMFYDHFKNLMHRKIREQDDDFYKEVALFDRCLEQTTDFCDNVCKHVSAARKSDTIQEAIIQLFKKKIMCAAGKSSPKFDITGLDCLLMRVSPTVFRDIQKLKLFPDVCTNQNKTLEELHLHAEYCKDLNENLLPFNVIKKEQFLIKCK